MKCLKKRIAAVVTALMVVNSAGGAFSPGIVRADDGVGAEGASVIRTDTASAAVRTDGASGKRGMRLAEADEMKYQGFTYEYGNDQGITIKGYSGVEKNIVIPERIDNRKVTRIVEFAFQDSDITGVTIPEGITYIGRGAFYNCSYLKEIHYNAVSCKCVQGDFDSGYDRCIFHKAGMNSEEGLKVVFGTNVEVVPADIFRSECYVSDISMSKQTKEIGARAFCGCIVLKEVTIPDSTFVIGDSAFEGCGKLEKVNMGSAVRSIDSFAFYRSGVKSITIPESVTSISKGAFAYCSYLREIYFNAPKCECKRGDFDGGYDRCVFYKAGMNSENGLKAIFGNTVEIIPDYIFCRDCFVDKVEISDSVIDIGASAFQGCEKLSGVELSSSVRKIGAFAFYGSGLKSIVVPEGVTDIDKGAFADCTYLKEIQYNALVCACNSGDYDGGYDRCIFHYTGEYSGGINVVFSGKVKKIPDFILRSDCYVKDIEIPSGVTEIGKDAFTGCCLNKINVHFPSSIEKVDGKIFHEKTEIDVLYYEGSEAEFNVSPLKAAVENIRVNKYVFNSKVQEEEKTYTLTFDTNGGSCATKTKVVQENASIGTLPKATRSGYTFEGWYTGKNNGAKVESTLILNKDMTVYAHWKEIPIDPIEEIKTYTLTFDANGGSCDTESRPVNENTEIGTLPQASRSGYIFEGWYTGRSSGTKVESTLKLDRDMTVYAHWEIIVLPEPSGKITPVFDNEEYMKTYDGKTVAFSDIVSMLQVSAEDSGRTIVPKGTFSLVNSTSLPKDAGTYVSTVRFTPEDTDKYETVEGMIAITIAKKPANYYLCVNGVKDSLELTAGSAKPKVTLRVSGLVNGESLFSSTKAVISGVPSNMNKAGVYTIRWDNADEIAEEIRSLSKAKNYEISVDDSYRLEIVGSSSSNTDTSNSNGSASNNSNTTKTSDSSKNSTVTNVTNRSGFKVYEESKKIVTIGKNRYSYKNGKASLIYSFSTAKKYYVASGIRVKGKIYKVTSISEEALSYSSSLRYVSISGNVKSIGKQAFMGCSKLSRIKLKGKGLKQVGKNAIKGIRKKARIQCPKKRKAAYKKLFKASTGFRKSMKIKGW